MWFYSHSQLTLHMSQGLNRKIFCAHGLEELTLLKMPIPPKAIYRFNAIPTKIPMAFFTEIFRTLLKFVWSHRRPPNSQNNLEKEEQSWRHQVHWFQTILQSYRDQTVRYCHKNRHIRSVEQKTEPQNKPTHIWSINLQQRSQEF